MDNLQNKPKHSSRSRDLLRGMNLIFKNPLTTFGLAIILVLMLTALFAPHLAPFPEQGKGQSNLGERLLPPSTRHPMGTDNLGRDILSRIIFGSRISLQVSVCVIVLVVMLGLR